MKALIAGAAVILVTTAAAPQAYDWAEADDEFSSSAEYQESKSICRQVRTAEPPAADRPDAALAASLKNCDSEALYYGIGMAADPVRARRCAFIEAETDDGVIGGSTMLMTIYANGVGAKRNFDVATHLACGIEGAPAESHGRVLHLAELKRTGWTGTDFHFCDDITSGLAMGHCRGHQARIAAPIREAALARLAAGWSGPQRAAFANLRKAHEAFVEAHSYGEVDLAGTARAALQIDAEETLRDELLDILERLTKGQAPSFGGAQFKLADAALNVAYRRHIGGLEPGDRPGAVTKQGVLDAQRAWLRYRDAFLDLSRLAFPRTSRESLATWLTQKRTAMWTEA